MKEVFTWISFSINSLYCPKCWPWYCTAENQESQRVAQGFGGTTAFLLCSLFVRKERYLLCVIQHWRTSGRNSCCSIEQKVCGRRCQWDSLCVPCMWCVVSWGTTTAELQWMPFSCRLHYQCQTQSHPRCYCCTLLGTLQQPWIQWNDYKENCICKIGQDPPRMILFKWCKKDVQDTSPLDIWSLMKRSQPQVFLQEMSSAPVFPSRIVLPSTSLVADETLEWPRHWWHSQ